MCASSFRMGPSPNSTPIPYSVGPANRDAFCGLRSITTNSIQSLNAYLFPVRYSSMELEGASADKSRIVPTQKLLLQRRATRQHTLTLYRLTSTLRALGTYLPPAGSAEALPVDHISHTLYQRPGVQASWYGWLLRARFYMEFSSHPS